MPDARSLMGFRPLGYADGDLVSQSATQLADADYVYPSDSSRQNALDFIATMTQAGDPTIASLLELSDAALRKVELKVLRDTEAGKYDHITLPDDITLPTRQTRPDPQTRPTMPPARFIRPGGIPSLVAPINQSGY